MSANYQPFEDRFHSQEQYVEIPIPVEATGASNEVPGQQQGQKKDFSNDHLLKEKEVLTILLRNIEQATDLAAKGDLGQILAAVQPKLSVMDPDIRLLLSPDLSFEEEFLYFVEYYRPLSKATENMLNTSLMSLGFLSARKIFSKPAFYAFMFCGLFVPVISSYVKVQRYKAALRQSKYQNLHESYSSDYRKAQSVSNVNSILLNNTIRKIFEKKARVIVQKEI